MGKLLLASTAAAALAVAVAGANAQNPPDLQQKPAASSEQHKPKGNANEEKGAPKANRSAEPREGRESGRSSQSSQVNEKSPKSSPSADRGSGAQNAQGAQPEKANAGEAKTKKQTTGASPGSQDSQKDQLKPGEQPKAGSASQKQQRSTTGQSSRKGDRLDQGTAPATQPGQNRSEQRGAPSESANQSNQAGSSQGSPAAAKPEQQTKFNEVIEKQKVQPITDANFSISVGSTVPRSVRAHEVPRDIVTIYPEYRGKEYVVVRDEIVIIEPRTHKIVSVIPRSGRATTGTSIGRSSTGLQLPAEKRRIIRETVIKEPAAPRCQDAQVTVGGEIPQTVMINRFPENIVREVPEIRSYQFCLKGNEVVLVDPTEHRVVEVIE